MGTLIIEAKIKEGSFMEGLLNLKHSGKDVRLPLLFYALANSWHIGKLNYYLKELDSQLI